MHAAAFVLATLVLLPYAALALAFALFGYAISGGTLLSFFQAVLAEATWIIPWGVIGAACAIVGLLTLGVIPSTRKIAAVVLVVLAIASLVAIWAIPAHRMGLDGLTFLLPCMAAAAVGVWLAAAS